MSEKDLARVEQTWAEIGFRFRPLRHVVLVRTYPLPTVTEGGIIIPEKLTSFYGELPHVQLVNATVLSSGPKAILEPGDRICFQRLFFARWLEMEDGSLVGWIADERNIVGWFEGDVTYAPMAANSKPAPKAPPELTGGKSGSYFGK